MCSRKICLIIILFISISQMHWVSSVLFERKINLQFRREKNAQSVFVRSLTECANSCVGRTKCVSFFYNHFDSLCQSDGKIYVSFDYTNAYSWIYYEMKMTNVAAFKSVIMSSEYNPSSMYHSPYYAVDDQVLNTKLAEKCASTMAESAPWIIIDLGNTFDVNYVTLFNLIDQNGERLRHISVSLGESAELFTVTCGRYAGPGENTEVVHVVCKTPARGQFAKIQINNSNQQTHLSLCEIRVMV